MYISPLAIAELKRIVEASEVVKEDDTKWPKKNIVGKQELEIKLGQHHISFEVRLCAFPSRWRPFAFPFRWRFEISSVLC